MHRPPRSIIQIVTLIAAAGCTAASIYLARSSAKDSVYLCAADRKWLPLYPKVIHSKDCLNDWNSSTIGILAGSAGIVLITFSVYYRTKKDHGNSRNTVNTGAHKPKRKTYNEEIVTSINDKNIPKAAAALTERRAPYLPARVQIVKTIRLRMLGAGIALMAMGLYLAPFLLYKTLDRINTNNTFAGSRAKVDGYWLDQYNASLYLLAHSLDDEFRAMRSQGAKAVLIHADSLPAIILDKMAKEAKREGLKAIAWIQKPNKDNLLRTGKLNNYDGVQVDDHFFASPPIRLTDLRRQVGKKQLWCSFQPKQYNSHDAQQCDHIDVQVYRNPCLSTLYAAESFGLTNRSNAAIAVYDDGSLEGRRETFCILRGLATMNGRVLVFKWHNQEVWTKPIWQLIGKVVRPHA